MYSTIMELKEQVSDIQDKMQNFVYKEKDKRLVEKCLNETKRCIEIVEKHKKYSQRNQDFDTKDVYLMKNDKGHTKIGISNNPNIREKTLQSENPTINCLFVCYGGGLALEKSLHKHFLMQGKHLRGEWFNLDDNDYEWLFENFSFVKTN